jgi:hypothetical protein
MFLEWIDTIEAQGDPEDVQFITRCRYLTTFNRLIVKAMHILCFERPHDACNFIPLLVKDMDRATDILHERIQKHSEPFADQMRNNPVSISFWANCQGVRLKLRHCMILLCNLAEQGLGNASPDAPEADTPRLRYIDRTRRDSFRAMRSAAQDTTGVISAALGEQPPSDTGSDIDSRVIDPRLPPWTVAIRLLYPLICAAQFQTVPPPVRQRARILLRVIATDLGIQQGLRAQRINDPWKMPVSAEWTVGCED